MTNTILQLTARMDRWRYVAETIKQAVRDPLVLTSRLQFSTYCHTREWSRYPARTFHKFQSVDRHILSSSKASIHGFDGCKTVQYSVGTFWLYLSLHPRAAVSLYYLFNRMKLIPFDPLFILQMELLRKTEPAQNWGGKMLPANNAAYMTQF